MYIIRSCKQEVAHCDNVIKQLEKEAIGNKEIKRRLNAVSMQKENKVRHPVTANYYYVHIIIYNCTINRNKR